MRDRLLTDQDRQEALSLAYVEAVAAKAGYVTSRMNFDRDGVDISVHAGGTMRPAVAMQLKATVNLHRFESDVLHFSLPIRNYELLRVETQVPRVLVVLDMPRDEVEWLTVTSEALIIRRCAYWVSLVRSPEVNNRTSVTVTLPAANRFDVDAVTLLMERSRSGDLS